MKPDCIMNFFLCVCVFFFFFKFNFLPIIFQMMSNVSCLYRFFCWVFLLFLTKRRKISAYISWHLHLCSFISPPFFHFLSLLNVHCERSELKFTALHGMYVYLVEFSRVRGWLYDFGTEATTQFSTGGGGLKGGWLV